jgi:hypothetical protein
MSLIDAIKEKQARIASLRDEIALLQAELHEARALLADANPIRVVGRVAPIPKAVVAQPKPKSRHGFTNGVRKKPIQEGSSVDWTRLVLEKVGEPMTVDEIIANIEALGGPAVKKPTLVSNLSRYVTHNDTFFRAGQSTYGLIGQTATGEPSLLEPRM